MRSDRELREDAAEARADHFAAFAASLDEQKTAHQEAMRDPNHWVWGDRAHRLEDARLLAEEQDALDDEETRWRHLFAEGAKREPVHYPGRPGVDGRSFDVSGQRGMR